MKALCASLGNEVPAKYGWLSLHQEYEVLAVLALPGRGIKFRVLSDDDQTPILADSSLFAALHQPLPKSWVCQITQGGVIELGPNEWLQPGFWERFFDRDAEAVGLFWKEVESLGG